MRPPSSSLGERGLKISEVFPEEGGVRNFYFGGGGGLYCWRVNFIGGGSGNFDVKIKLHNTSIKSIFGITDLIYVR